MAKFEPTPRARSESELVIQRLYAITSDFEAGFDAQLDDLLTMGCDRFNLDIGILSRIVDGQYEVVAAHAPEGVELAPGDTFPLGNTYCCITLEADCPVGFEHVAATEVAQHPAYKAFALEAYIGTPVRVAGAVYGTLNFSSAAPHARKFRDVDVESLMLMKSWLEGELARQQVDAELRQTVEKLSKTAQALEQSRQDLERSNGDLERFAYVAAHDLKEPLRMIGSFSELLEESLAGKLSDNEQEFFHYIRDGARRGQELIAGIMDYSRLEQAEARAWIEIGDVVRDVADRLKRARPDALILVDDELPRIWCNPTLAARLFENLIGNGLKYNDSTTPTARVTATLENGCWQIVVADNGVGIAAEDAGKVFDMFYRGEHRARFEGTGIGLAICRRIMELHGGSVALSSDLGRGSVFTCSFPRLGAHPG